MLQTLKAEWQRLKHTRPGRRFCSFYQRHGERWPGWARVLLILAAAISFAIGFILVFIPGPAILFFAITAALLAAQSRPVARQLDRAEILAHRYWQKYTKRRTARQATNRRAHADE